MKSLKPGKNTSKVEVLNISKHGVWLLVKGKEYFMPYELFPWFLNARISEVHHVRLEHDRHLHWPDLDVDLDIHSLAHPEEYPLTYEK